MTGHEVDERMLAPELRGYAYASTRGRVRHAEPDMVDASFDLFLDAIEPLRAAGKLGGILMQFPPYFTAKTARGRNGAAASTSTTSPASSRATARSSSSATRRGSTTVIAPARWSSCASEGCST